MMPAVPVFQGYIHVDMNQGANATMLRLLLMSEESSSMYFVACIWLFKLVPYGKLR